VNFLIGPVSQWIIIKMNPTPLIPRLCLFDADIFAEVTSNLPQNFDVTSQYILDAAWLIGDKLRVENHYE